MYDRRVGETELSFGHSGRLYERSFVFYDHQTGSLWVHVTGEARTGPYEGTKLTFIPSTVTSWREWKKTYPRTTVLPGLGRTGFMGTYRGFYPDGQIGLVVSRLNRAKLYPFDILEKTPVINDTFDGEPIVVAFHRAQRTATAWKRTLDGHTLTFTAQYDPKQGLLISDRETGSQWNILTGTAIRGHHTGRELPALTFNPIQMDRFPAHYPQGEVYSP